MLGSTAHILNAPSLPFFFTISRSRNVENSGRDRFAIVSAQNIIVPLSFWQLSEKTRVLRGRKKSTTPCSKGSLVPMRKLKTVKDASNDLSKNRQISKFEVALNYSTQSNRLVRKVLDQRTHSLSISLLSFFSRSLFSLTTLSLCFNQPSAYYIIIFYIKSFLPSGLSLFLPWFLQRLARVANILVSLGDIFTYVKKLRPLSIVVGKFWGKTRPRREERNRVESEKARRRPPRVDDNFTGDQ